MSLVPRPEVLIYALSAAIFFLFALAATCAMARQKRHVIAPAIIIILFSFTAWKQGFVRADAHVLMFLYFLPVAQGFLFHPAFNGSAPGTVRIALVAWLLCSGRFVPNGCQCDVSWLTLGAN